MDDWLLGFAAALAIAAITTPAGVSGAVFLLPMQVSVLGVPSPSVTPTNLLYNVVAIPGSLLRFARDRAPGGRLTRLLVAGTVPGAVAGAVIRVELLPGPEAFLIVVGAVLAPLGALLAFRPPAAAPRAVAELDDRWVVLASVGVGIVGGVYGIGGGSILAPALVSLGLSIRAVAPAALTSTFVTSVVAIATYGLLSLRAEGTVAPDWVLGLFLGAGGLIGGYLGAAVQPAIPEGALRRGLGVVAVLLGARYLVVALP